MEDFERGSAGAGASNSCPLCGGRGHPTGVGRLTIYVCAKCGHGWQAVTRADNEHFESLDYLRWRIENEPTMRRRAEEYVTTLERMSGRTFHSAAEIGCSTGETLGSLAARGCRCWGADMSAIAVDHARRIFPGIDFVVGEMPAPEGMVDVVLMLHVIEHVADPIAVIRSARRLVAWNGLLYLRLPNFGGLARRLFGRSWPDYMPDHVHYFTKNSLSMALTKGGWRVVSTRTAGQAWAWLGGLKRAVKRQRPAGHSGTSLPPGPESMRILSMAERWGAPLWRLEGRLGIGNELIVLASPSIDQ